MMSLFVVIACLSCLRCLGNALVITPDTKALSNSTAPLLNAIIVKKGAMEKLFAAVDAANSKQAGNETSEIRSNSTERDDSTCSQCSKAEFETWMQKKKAVSEEEERRIRIEIIKAQILEKLGLATAPNTTYYHETDDVIDDGYFDDDVGMWDKPMKHGPDDDGFQADSPQTHYGHHEDTTKGHNAIKRIIVYGKAVTPCQSSVPSACFAFRLSPKIMNLDGGTIASAHLKLHVTMNSRSKNVKANITSQYNSQLKTKKQHIMAMYHYHDDAPKTTSGQIKNSRTHTSKFVEARQVETNGKQSVVFDVTHALATQLKHALHRRADQILHGSLHGGKKRDDDAMTLQFQCKTCVTDQTFAVVTEGRHAPYVVIKVGKQRHRQRRQVIECHPFSTICCRDKLYIDFAAIGWNHWILQPSGYNANFCRGDCKGLLLPSTRHQTVVSQYDVVEPIPRYRSCCAATSYSPLSLLYYDESDGTIMERRLDNLQVDSCACTT